MQKIKHLYRSYWRRLKRLASSFKGTSLWPLWVGISLIKTLFKKAIGPKKEIASSKPFISLVLSAHSLPFTKGKVSVIIPTKDESVVLKKCIDSIYSKTLYQNFEILVVSNNSQEKSLFTLLEMYKKEHGDAFQYYESNEPFNYSKLMNEAALRVSGQHLLFLNNDTEVISPGWIGEMVAQSERSDIGCVGCKLLYFDETIQHAGIILKIKKGFGVHAFLGEPRDLPEANTIRNYSALTGACLMCKGELFYKVGGFDENFPVSLNDVDFCLRIKELGFNHVYLPHVELYHYESLTRGSPSATSDSSKQQALESALLKERWANTKYLN